jgi:RNA polymerase sigma-70 factor (ECF subfamily)
MNKCRDYLRCKKVDISIDDIGEPLSCTRPDPEGSMYQKQLGRTLQKAIGGLPEDYREVIVLKHIEGLDYKEMESILGVSVNALKVRTYRAREMLKKFLIEAGVSNG